MNHNKTFLESFMTYFPLEMRAATENALMAPSQITINKQENVLRGRVESLKHLKNHVFSSNSRPTTPIKVNTPRNNSKNKNNRNKAGSRSSTGSSVSTVKSPTNMFGGRRTRRKRRN